MITVLIILIAIILLTDWLFNGGKACRAFWEVVLILVAKIRSLFDGKS